MKMRAWIFSGLIVTLTSCSHLPQHSISATHTDYQIHLRQAERHQLFYNIIALHYNEAPYFMTATSLVSQLSTETNFSAEVAIRPPIDDAKGGLGAAVTIKETPTISYSPLVGKNYVKTLLTPISPSLILSLVETGWPIDTLLALTLRSINGIPNNSSSTSFNDVMRILRQLQKEDKLAIYAEINKADEQTRFVLQNAPGNAAAGALGLLTSILNMPEAALTEPLIISFKPRPEHPNELALVTRSMFDVLQLLGGILQPSASTTPLSFSIQSAETPPPKSYVSTQFNGQYFWIAADDNTSQLTFLLTQLLFELSKEPPQLIFPLLNISKE